MHSHNHTLQMFLACIGLALIPFGAFVAQPSAAADSRANETAKTAAAVIAVDPHWEQAEESGEACWLDGMLMPD